MKRTIFFGGAMVLAAAYWAFVSPSPLSYGACLASALILVFLLIASSRLGATMGGRMPRLPRVFRKRTREMADKPERSGTGEWKSASPPEEPPSPSSPCPPPPREKNEEMARKREENRYEAPFEDRPKMAEVPPWKDDRKMEEVPTGAIPRADIVDFTVTAPAMLSSGRSHVIAVWVHYAIDQEKILSLAKNAISAEEIRAYSKVGIEIPYGVVLTMRLSIPGLEVGDPEDTLRWLGKIANVTFSVTVPQAARMGSYPGTVSAFSNGLRVAKVQFVLEIGPETLPSASVKIHKDLPASAFASYANEDRDDVLARIQGMSKVNPEMDVFVDVASLHSGEHWPERLVAEIERRDIFYLFWSKAASESPWVDKEWRTALEKRGLNYIDPVPLVSPDQVPPPTELGAELHFNDWMLAYMRGRRTQNVPRD